MTAATGRPRSEFWGVSSGDEINRDRDSLRTFVRNGQLGIRFSGEVELRASLAEMARALGWLVEEEVVVPGWGRIDLVLREVNKRESILVELKLDLTKPAKVRRAFQQADGYGRWWAANRGLASSTWLVSVEGDDALINGVQDLYIQVRHRTLPVFMSELAWWGHRPTRLLTAMDRLQTMRELVAFQEQAVEDLLDSPPP